MSDASKLSESKRALLEKYLRGEFPQTTKDMGTITRQAQGGPASLSNTDLRVPLLTIQTDGSKRPFFYLHVHYEGGAFYCFPLAHDLGAEQPFYVLDPYNFDGLRVPPTLEDMTAAYIKSMRAVQPEGPYLLGGFCGGGVIAFEMARRLCEEGQTVDLLVLLEPGVGPLLMTSCGSFIHHLGKMIRLRPDKQLDCFLRIRHLCRFLFRLPYRNQQGLSLFPAVEALRQDWIGIFVWMFSASKRPRRYHGKATYFWASDDPYRRKTWPKLAEAKEAELHFIPGVHFSLITDQLRVVSNQLKACLDKVQTLH